MLIAQQDVSVGSGLSAGATIAILAAIVVVSLFYIAAMWKVFTKAGRPGWHAIIPILNTYTLIKIAGRPGWWLLLMFIPCVSFIVAIVVLLDVATAFGKGAGFGLGLIFLGPIFIPILGFGSSSYGRGLSPRLQTAYTGGPPNPGAGFGGAAPSPPPNWSGSTGSAAGVPPVPQPAPSQQGLPPMGPGAAAPGPPARSLPPIGATSGAQTPSPPPFPPSAPPFPPSAPPFPPSAPAAPEPPSPSVPAASEPGWYPDPSGAPGNRWWDGSTWTEHTSS